MEVLGDNESQLKRPRETGIVREGFLKLSGLKNDYSVRVNYFVQSCPWKFTGSNVVTVPPTPLISSKAQRKAHDVISARFSAHVWNRFKSNKAL